MGEELLDDRNARGNSYLEMSMCPSPYSETLVTPLTSTLGLRSVYFQRFSLKLFIIISKSLMSGDAIRIPLCQIGWKIFAVKGHKISNLSIILFYVY